MTRKAFIIILLLFAAIIAVAVVWYSISCRQMQGQENKALSTDCASYAEEEIIHADLRMVGKWQNTDNPNWYKVYYDDCDEDSGLFWGKEWDESDEVFEEDLHYHGNGWFRWEKKGNILCEHATMDLLDLPITRQ